MRQQNQPTKEQVRHYMALRQTQNCPPPSIHEIRRQLGWQVLQSQDSAAELRGRM